MTYTGSLCIWYHGAYYKLSAVDKKGYKWMEIDDNIITPRNAMGYTDN